MSSSLFSSILPLKPAPSDEMEKLPGYDEATRSTPTETSSVFDGATKSPSLKYALISIAWTDRIRLLRFPEHTTERISAVLRAAWPKGIQHVKLVADHPEIKLKGNPFSYAQDDEKIAIRRCFLEIFDVLAQEGWGVHPVLAGTGRIGTFGSKAEKDCIVFQRQPAQRLSWMCVSFDSSSYIHLINSPPEFGQSIIQVFGDRVEKCNRDLVSGNFEIKFRDGPWSGSFKNAVSSRLIILDVLRCLEEHGYALCASVDFDNGSGGSVYKSSANTWFCCRS
ncbi:hypothetical protein N8T08_009613 [Aspergillus melleus]|uniref:Uncharacterized protein n=1 Tax=Aspergillus melleus TaxID=138277 RepID=A0ACC3AT76_9EURO|nr:hypothetical protein N8T08_009613 [Aspergillus melleus]